MNKNKSLKINEAFNLAVENHHKNNLKEAQNLYNRVLEINSRHLRAINNLGVLNEALEYNQKSSSLL